MSQEMVLVFLVSFSALQTKAGSTFARAPSSILTPLLMAEAALPNSKIACLLLQSLPCVSVSRGHKCPLVSYLTEDRNGNNNNKTNQLHRKMEFPQVSSIGLWILPLPLWVFWFFFFHFLFFLFCVCVVSGTESRKNKSRSCTSWQLIIVRSFSGLPCRRAATLTDSMGTVTKKDRKENWAGTKEMQIVPYLKKFRSLSSQGKHFY